MGTGDDELAQRLGMTLDEMEAAYEAAADEDPEDCECGFPGETCNCDEANEWGERCGRCRDWGWFIPEHCCECQGSPYCTCCRACGASCVSQCSCPITVQLESGGELVL